MEVICWVSIVRVKWGLGSGGSDAALIDRSTVAYSVPPLSNIFIVVRSLSGLICK